MKKPPKAYAGCHCGVGVLNERTTLLTSAPETQTCMSTVGELARIMDEVKAKRMPPSMLARFAEGINMHSLGAMLREDNLSERDVQDVMHTLSQQYSLFGVPVKGIASFAPEAGSRSH